MTDASRQEERIEQLGAGPVDVPDQPQTVPVNVYEAEEAVVVVAPLPGVMPDDIEVRVENGSLRISAAMRSIAQKDYLVHEWHYGPYEREVQLPAGYGGDGSASFGNGQLAVRVKKGSGTGATTIPVTQHG